MKKNKTQIKKNTSSPAIPENLVLIGMFGSGKSTIGKILAGKLRYHFVDVDQLIESKKNPAPKSFG